MKYFNKNYIFLLLTISLLSFLSMRTAYGAEPQLFITWHASTYIPKEYNGKALPVAKSKFTVSFELLDNGQLVDVSNQTVYWYLNDNLLSNTPGVQEITLHAPEVGNDSVAVRVQLPNYKPDSLTVKTITIPIVFPKAIIYSPSGNSIPLHSPATLAAIPYFFNVPDTSSLDIAWDVNDTTPTSQDDPQFLTINLDGNTPVGAQLIVNLMVKNPAAFFESTKTTTALTVQ